MTRRIIMCLYLPLDGRADGRILRAAVSDYPDAVINDPSPDGNMFITADPDISLSERRKNKREHDRAVRKWIAGLKPGESIGEWT